MNKLPILILIVLFTFPVFASAQAIQKFSVSPTLINVEAESGQNWQTEIRVINANPYELRLFVQLMTFVPEDEGGVPRFVEPDRSATSTFANWIQTETEIVVPPEQTYAIPIQVTVPENAPPGGHYAAVLIGTKRDDLNPNQPLVGTSQIISSLLFLRVGGDIEERAGIRSFRTTDFLLTTPETTFELRVENKGNVHVLPRGEIKIFNMWGQERGIIPINKQSLFGNVLPETVRNYRFTWSGEWSLADIGRYTAETTLTYGEDQKQFMTADTAFWLVPWKWILVVIIMIGLFILLMRWAITAYIRHMLRLAGVDANFASANQEYEVVTKKVKTSVVAPLEAGMLDLRNRLESSEKEKSRLSIIIEFAVQYWRFFAVIIAIILFVIFVVWFITTALQSERSFEITSDSGVVTSSEQIDTGVQVGDQAVPSGKLLTVVNRSGNVLLTESVVNILTAQGFAVTATDFDDEVVEETTVVVYPATETERALAISQILQESPVSALDDADVRTSEIIVYIGKDANDW